MVKRKNASKEVLLYIATAMIGNIIDFSIFSGLNFLGISLIFSQWVAAVIGNTHNFFWQYFLIFDHNQDLKKSYAQTILLALLLIAISGPLLAYIDIVVQNATVSKLILFPTIGGIGFLVRKYCIFRKT